MLIKKKMRNFIHWISLKQTLNICVCIWLPTPGLEPGPCLGQGFKPCMSTNSII